MKCFWVGRVCLECDGAEPAAALGRVDTMVEGPGRSPARAGTVWQRWRTTRDRARDLEAFRARVRRSVNQTTKRRREETEMRIVSVKNGGALPT